MSPEKTEKITSLCECIKSVFVAADTVSLDFLWPGPAPRAGQFFLIKPRRTGMFLGRPISAAGWEPREQKAENAERRIVSERRIIRNRRIKLDRRIIISSVNTNWRAIANRRIKFDRRLNLERRLGLRMEARGILRFIVVRRGRGSGELVDMRQGEEAKIIGPLGNYWARADIKEGPVALIGGGIGIAPLLAFAQELNRPFDFYAGFRTGSFGLEKIKPRSLIVATEDGSQGLKGRIPDYFTPSGYSGVFACGPEPMLRIVGDACIAGGVPCFISMERHMACGVGACLGCTVRTIAGNRRCCADGPIFNAEELCFDSQ